MFAVCSQSAIRLPDVKFGLCDADWTLASDRTEFANSTMENSTLSPCRAYRRWRV